MRAPLLGLAKSIYYILTLYDICYNEMYCFNTG